MLASPDHFRWVPIRTLAERHRPRIEAHLCALDAQDRYLRFGSIANDALIARYVAALDFDRDEIFGIFNRRLDLIALAHLAYEPTPQRADKPPMAEFGVSVLKRARGRSFGARLFEHAMLHARNRRIDTLFIHALSENAAMLHIARKAGAKVERDGSESEAWLKLPPDSFGSHLDQFIGDSAAELDYQMKRRAFRFGDLFDKPATGRSADGKSH